MEAQEEPAATRVPPPKKQKVEAEGPKVAKLPKVAAALRAMPVGHDGRGARPEEDMTVQNVATAVGAMVDDVADDIRKISKGRRQVLKAEQALLDSISAQLENIAAALRGFAEVAAAFRTFAAEGQD